MCPGYFKNSSRSDASYENPQHVLLRNKKLNFRQCLLILESVTHKITKLDILSTCEPRYLKVLEY